MLATEDLLDASVTEVWLPYSLVHAAFIDTVLGQHVEGDRVDGEVLKAVLLEQTRRRRASIDGESKA